jgi:hypothetical protein
MMYAIIGKITICTVIVASLIGLLWIKRNYEARQHQQQEHELHNS